MHDRRSEIEARITRAVEQRIVPALHTPVARLSLEVWHVPPAPDGKVGEPVPFAEARAAAYEPCQVGDAWGPAWGTSWFHVTGQVPDDLATPELLIDLGWSSTRPGMQAEGLVHRADGRHVKGLNPRNNWVPVRAGETVDLYVEAAANPTLQGSPRFWPTTEGDRLTAGDRRLYRVKRADVCQRNEDVAELAADIDVLDGLMRALPEPDPRRWEILHALEAALDRLDPQEVVTTAAAARAELTGVLSRPANASAHQVSAVGHAHIDSAWLWPVRETVRKVARTVANVVNLIDSGDELVHAMSSAQQWAWLEEHHPALYERAAEQVRAGRLVPVGGMWVESDTNMVGGEAMARQFLHGKRWFLEKLGIDCLEVWLPDSFGYTAALPQIVKLAGFRWFLTQKISWNTDNLFPHHTFWWEGIDGTRVFTHFPPADTYNGTLSGSELARASANFRDKGKATRSLVPFGYGDGGGGPTREMLARARRTADLEGSPRVTIEAPAAFFAAAEEEYADAPVWVGELYLEIHRGTYTSQARTKQGNRRSEHLLREAELWAATAAVRGLLAYPYDELEQAWRTVLLHQFHDILPGSSIAWVHRETAEAHAAVARALEAIIDSATAALAASEQESPGTEVGFNAAPVRSSEGGAAMGASRSALSATPTTVTRDGEEVVLDNGWISVRVDGTGVVRSLTDLATGRETVPPGGGANRLQLHPDTPNKWDAWDIDRFYRHVVTDLAGEISVDESEVVVRYAFGDSTVQQRIRLAPASSSVDVETEVDWHEREKVLKLAVDVDVHTDHARYETQFGHVTRPTHENTSWDAARFEVCAHRWVHVGDSAYGVAVANDATYGHDVTRHARDGGGTYSTIRLSLLRAPRYPDPDTDQGRHTFRCAIVPGAGVRDAIAAGYHLNLPVRRRPGGEVAPIVSVEGSAYVEAVKLAEDRSGDVVVRLYEPLGARSTATVRPGFAFAGVEEVDLLEGPLPLDALTPSEPGNPARLDLRPFQIVSLRFRRR